MLYNFELGPNSMEAVKNNFELGPNSMEAVKNDFELGPNSMEVVKNNFELGPNSMEVVKNNFELGPNSIEAVKNICCAKGKGIVGHNTVTKWLKNFCFGCKNLNNQARLVKSKIIDSKVVHNIQKQSGKFGIS